MSSFPNSPKLLKGGLVLIDPETAMVQRVIALQYNPDSLSRSFQIKGVGAESGDRSEALRLKGPPVETIKVEADIDGTDQLEVGDAGVTQVGIAPQLAVLEAIVYPTSGQLLANQRLAQAGKLEITPMETPLTLFVWSKHRILPVRITEFSITEEAFDPSLNPLRAKVSLGMRVLTVDDVGFGHKAGALFMSALQVKEQLAAGQRSEFLNVLGIGAIP